MDKENNKSPDNQNTTPENKDLGKDFEMWLKGRKEQKEFLVAKNHINTQSQLADLRESF